MFLGFGNQHDKLIGIRVKVDVMQRDDTAHNRGFSVTTGGLDVKEFVLKIGFDHGSVKARRVLSEHLGHNGLTKQQRSVSEVFEDSLGVWVGCFSIHVLYIRSELKKPAKGSTKAG